MKRPILRSLAFGLAVVAMAAGCGKSGTPFVVEPLRPVVEITFAPIEQDSVSYAVRINWSASDSDGQVVGFQYAVDPPASPTPDNDTVWVSTTSSEVALLFPSRQPRKPLAPPGTIVPSSDYHTFVIRAIDNEGYRSVPQFRSFTSFTIAPSTNITRPNGTAQLAISTTPSVNIEWSGDDPDGTQRPVKYKYRLVQSTDIAPDVSQITAGVVQAFFEADAVNYFASWDSVAGDTTSRFYEGLTAGTRYYFAIVAIDEAGAYEPRFNLDTNVLQFQPTLDKLGPKIRVFNEFFSRVQSVGGVSLNESRIVKLEFPADASLVFNWSAEPPQQGVLITGYRWCVDIAGQDITNETPRTDDNDVNHWSTWSLNETSARIGPFTASPDTNSTHYFYLEARDNLGFVSLYTIRLTIVKPSFGKNLLIVDDLYGSLTQAVDFRDPGGAIRLSGSYPLEAEQDSFYVARGGYPDSLYIRSGTPGVLSQAGVFAAYAPDTLDYQFYPIDGIDLTRLAAYKAVCWYTDGSSSARQGPRFGSTQPATAIRAINSRDRLNTLAVYLRQGGKAWLFGEGMTTAIGNGYFTRFGSVPRIPYTSGEDPRTNVLFQGCFLYDFCHLRSEITTGGGTTFLATQLRSCIPNLPEYIGPATDTDRTHDPRINPLSAARTATRWGDWGGVPALPRLTIAAYRGATAAPGISSSWFIKQANQINDGGPAFIPTMDTLYYYQARTYDPNRLFAPNEADGFPNAVYYYGTENGPGSQLVWFGFPLHFFERDQVRAVVDKVMQNFGIAPAPPSLRGAHPAELAGPRVLDYGETVDDRVAETRRVRR